MGKQPKRTSYVDINTLSDVSQLRDHARRIPGIAEVRQILLSSASPRTIVVSQHLLSEMAGYESSARRLYFERDMAFLNELGFLKVFKAQDDLMGLEVQRAVTGSAFDPFINAHFPIEYEDPEWKELFEGERRWVKSAKGLWAQEEREAKARIDDKYSDLDERKTKLTAAWREDSRGVIGRFIRHKMGVMRAQLGLPDDESTWPDPALLRTLWCHWAYLLTRAILIEIDDEPPEQLPSDVFDWLHFQSAAYADEFVTSDKGLLKIIREAPGPKPDVLSLEQWVVRLLRE